MLIKLVIVLVASVLCGVFYRMGGAKGYSTFFRDAGSALCMVGCAVLLGGIPGSMANGDVTFIWGILMTLASFGLTWGALSTYRYFLKKPENYTCWYYLMHGFFVALALTPWAWAAGEWLFLIVRCVACAALVGLWSGLVRWDVLEEWGRGFVMCSTISLLAVL